MQMEETNRVESRGNYEGPAHAGFRGRQQPAAKYSERPFSHNVSGCLQPVVSSQSQMQADAAITSLDTVGSRAWLLEWVPNYFRWVVNLLWWVANHFRWVANHFRWVANHMWQLVKPAAGCEPRLENATIAQQPLLPAQPHRRVPMDYDVFLNHRGPDVKVGFIAHLHEALEAMGLKSFLDKESLAQGSPAFASIDGALEVAKVHVAVVSVGYAESKYCLTELVAMLRSGKPVIPVFYDVEPAQLRRVETGAFAKAFQKHRSRETADQVREWTDALRKLADITAFVFRSSDYLGNEAKLKRDVVHAVLRLLPRFCPLQVEKYLVGLEGHLETCVSAVKAMSDSRSVLGLVGMGGVGKSCLARVVYNHLGSHGEFKAACFLEVGQNLRSSVKHVKLGWMQSLQAQLLRDLLCVQEQRQAQQHYEYWFDKLSSLGPILIGLDDIQDKDHFDKLIPIADALAPGSCIIVTSRDRHFLKRINGIAKFYLYEVIPLGNEDSLKLFNWHAFGDEEAPKNFKALSSGVSKAYDGLPLALKVVGSGLHGKFSSDQQEYIWPEAMKALGHRDVRRALRWSYECLSKQEKLMFVDIAFLFCGWKKVDILQILQSCEDCFSCCGNMSPHTSLDHLIDKSLVTLDKNEINMHALVQELGLHIGKEEGSHLSKAVEFRVQNGDKVRALKLASIGRDFEVNINKFKEMPNLHFLVLNECVLHGNNEDIFEVRYLQLKNCTIKHALRMPNLSNLVSLDLSGNSKFIGLELALEDCPNLVTLNLSKCCSIRSLPHSIWHLSKLEVLNLTDCQKLEKLPDSIDHLTSLQELQLSGCESLVALPKFIRGLKNHSGLYINELYEYNCLKDEQYYFTPINPESRLRLIPEVVVFTGFVNKNARRECSVVVSTNIYQQVGHGFMTWPIMYAGGSVQNTLYYAAQEREDGDPVSAAVESLSTDDELHSIHHVTFSN